MNRLAVALALLLWGCGGSKEPPPPKATSGAPADPRAEPAAAIVRGYSPARHSREVLCEAIRQVLVDQTKRCDPSEVNSVLQLVRSLKGKPEGPAAEQAMEKAFVEALRKFSSPTADFIALETTLSRQADPKLARLLIDTHLRVDRAAAEQILYVKSFEWMTAPPRDPREMYFSPNVLIPIARERDPARTKKALLAWMDASARQLGRQDSSMLNQLDEGVMAILDEGATKEDYKRLVAHPLMIQAPHGFIFRWAVSRKAKFDVNAEDLADFMVAQMEIQRHGFNFQLFEQFLGKSLPGPNDSLVRGLAKILPKAGEEMARSWTGWAEYLGPGFEKLSPAEMKDLQDRLRPSPDGMSGMRVLCTYLVSIQKGAREGTPAVFAAALGPDAPRNQKWIELFAYPGLPADAPKALAEGLQKPELPLASLEQGVYTGLTQKWKKEMTPVLRKAFQTRKENLQNLQGLARSHYTKAEWDAITKP